MRTPPSTLPPADTESPFYSGERYFANAFDAERHRLWQREREEREAERRRQYEARQARSAAA